MRLSNVVLVNIIRGLGVGGIPAYADEVIDIDTQSGKGTALLGVEDGAGQNYHGQPDCDCHSRPAALVLGLARRLF